MQRHHSRLLSSALGAVTATYVAPAGFMGIFGIGLYRSFSKNGSFTVPSGVTRIRVRVVGAGEGGTNQVRGGHGAGYAHGVFDVTPGDVYPVTVGVGGLTANAGSGVTDGGSSSFGALISATGGTGAGPGMGVGGDFRARGGYGAVSAPPIYGGGGGAGSQLGNGGNAVGRGGGGVVHDAGVLGWGGSAFGSGDVGGPNIIGARNGTDNPINAVIRFPFDGFTGAANNGGSGGGGNGYTTSAASGGGIGGGGGGSHTSSMGYGPGGLGGGGGCNVTSSSPTDTGKGGDGFVVVEW
mgnify:CR=1 FL=1